MTDQWLTASSTGATTPEVVCDYAIHCADRVESGTETSPRGVLGRSASGGSNPYEGGALSEFTRTRPIRVEKRGNQWVAQCRCGFRWRTIHHRLALTFALGHEHTDPGGMLGPTCLDHFLSPNRGCPQCQACPCQTSAGQCKNCGANHG